MDNKTEIPPSQVHEDIHKSTSFEESVDDEKSIRDTSAIEKQLVRKLDLHLLIWAFFGYFANGLDRNNMPNAQTTGLSEDLGLVGDQYNWAVTMFFIGYIV
jgi:sugar phosphate permease